MIAIVRDCTYSSQIEQHTPLESKFTQISTNLRHKTMNAKTHDAILTLLKYVLKIMKQCSISFLVYFCVHVVDLYFGKFGPHHCGGYVGARGYIVLCGS